MDLEKAALDFIEFVDDFLVGSKKKSSKTIGIVTLSVTKVNDIPSDSAYRTSGICHSGDSIELKIQLKKSCFPENNKYLFADIYSLLWHEWRHHLQYTKSVDDGKLITEDNWKKLPLEKYQSLPCEAAAIVCGVNRAAEFLGTSLKEEIKNELDVYFPENTKERRQVRSAWKKAAKRLGFAY